MDPSIDELLLEYARLGLDHWSKESERVKRRARRIQVDIATKIGVATRAVTNPFEPFAATGEPMRLIPMPCRQNHVFAAFFAPWLGRGGRDRMSFDLVVLSAQGAPFAFRFEPGSQYARTAHGYDHVQMNESLGQRQVELDGAVSPLPTRYPALPIPSECPLTRFLAMAVSMHGFPDGVDVVLEDAFKGQALKRNTYWDIIVQMLGKVKSPSPIPSST